MKCCGLPGNWFGCLRIYYYITMKKSFYSYFLAVLLISLGAIASSCNSDETWGYEQADYSGTAVTGFSLKADASVLNNLDSVYFSIDLIESKIYNAAPLPYGTKIDSIAVSISSDLCTVAELRVKAKDADQEDIVVDYLTAPDSKINFSNGPVTLHLVSGDGQHERDYQITLNVATEVSDSLYWDKLQAGNIYGVEAMKRSKTVKVNDYALTLSVSSIGKAGISKFIPAEKNGGGNWDSNIIEPVFTNQGTIVDAASMLNTESFTATENGILYITDVTGSLYRSQDGGANFEMVDNGWKSISAPYLDGILGVKENVGNLTWTAYPSSTWAQAGNTIDAEFPLSGISGAAVFTTKWAAKPQIVITGGKKTDGTVSDATWAFDGNKWAKISNSLPAGTGYCMTTYTIAETDTINWETTQREVLITFGGQAAKPLNEVWISRDMGVNWQEGSATLQLPEYIPFTTEATLLVFEKTLEAPPSATPLAVKPITSWECPYLYLFGGYDSNGNIRSQYWSGVVNHLKFKPLQ